MTWLPHNKFVGKSQSCENALANSQRHSSGTSRSAKRPRANHKPQQDEAESRSSRAALGATRRISAGDRHFGSAARVAHARARGLDILQNCHGAKSRGRKKKGQRQEGGNTKEKSRDKDDICATSAARICTSSAQCQKTSSSKDWLLQTWTS